MDGSAPSIEAHAPPNDQDAEAAVLSALFLDQTISLPELEPQHFFYGCNQWVYRAISAVGADIVLVAHWLRDQGRLAEVGGQPYLLQLADGYPKVACTAAATRGYARIVHELYRRRTIIRACQHVTAELYTGTTTAQDAWARVKEACT